MGTIFDVAEYPNRNFHPGCYRIMQPSLKKEPAETRAGR